MARINLKTIKRIEKMKYSIHEEVFTTYSVFYIYGEKFVNIDTYGKLDRLLPDKASQSIQIDRNSASYLVNLLKGEFGI